MSRFKPTTTECAEERSLEERLRRRIAVEQHFARTGHTYRHGPLQRNFERYVITPVLKHGLRLTGLYGRGFKNAVSPVVRNIQLYFPDLPSAFDGFEILHLSDLHIDGTRGLADVLARALRDLRPDVCLLTGDYRFEDRGPCEQVYPLMRSVVDNISAEHGVYGILGNHDSAQIALELEKMGVRMLINESAELTKRGASIWLVGVDDPFDYQCDDLPGALRSVPAGAFKILLAHAPELYRDASHQGIHLYLCGHTHAGQIRMPFVGSLRHNAKCPRSYGHGAWRHKSMHGYTSAGVGCSTLPVRFNCPPELVLIELRKHRS